MRWISHLRNLSGGSSSGNQTQPMSAIKLYRYLFRECDKLPGEAQEHYKHAIRQSYTQHKSESDSERVREIINQALEDAKWIQNKYSPKAR